MKKFAIVSLVLISAMCLAIPSFACDGCESCDTIYIEGNIEGGNWGNFELSLPTSPEGVNFEIGTGSMVSGYALMKNTGGDLGGGGSLYWQGGAEINASMDFGNMQINAEAYHITEVSIDVDPS